MPWLSLSLGLFGLLLICIVAAYGEDLDDDFVIPWRWRKH